ncbi:VWA domain-containing protein [Candidatus Dependentiae bacterium]|nr:VWA domain-containing protein [Candidatus Dependentiae bacterium]
MIELFGIYWAGTNKIFLIPVFILGIFLIIRNYIKNKKNISKLVDPKNINSILQNWSCWKEFLKVILFSSALFCIMIAMFQPQWGKKESSVMQEGRDLLIALDISRSMLAKDLKPNRLNFTKLKIRNLLKKMDFERVGLILFSGSAFLQCPLTSDYTAFLMFLDQVDVESIASGTTAIDSALLKAVDVFKNSGERKNKLLLLATDGEDFSLNIDKAKNQAQKEGIKLFAYGVGTTQGAPIPKMDSQGRQIGHELDSNGQIALSILNQSFLQDICDELNGSYIQASYDDSDIENIAKIIRRFEKEKFEDRQISYYQDQYPWLLGVAFILLILEWIL